LITRTGIRTEVSRPRRRSTMKNAASRPKIEVDAPAERLVGLIR
jgi:hypothetical protein